MSAQKPSTVFPSISPEDQLGEFSSPLCLQSPMQTSGSNRLVRGLLESVFLSYPWLLQIQGCHFQISLTNNKYLFNPAQQCVFHISMGNLWCSYILEGYGPYQQRMKVINDCDCLCFHPTSWEVFSLIAFTQSEPFHKILFWEFHKSRRGSSVLSWI